MADNTGDFGTGLRAHLGLERTALDAVAEPAAAVEPANLDEIALDPDVTELEALGALEAELVERERTLALREATLASRAGSLLAAAQALYDEVLGGGPSPHDDELALLRRRRSIA